MSYGQHLTGLFLKGLLPYPVTENHRPDWLFGMELDFYFPTLNLAIEFNGDQHIIHTKFGCPKAQMWRDYRKKKLCKERRIKLLVLEAIDLEYHYLRSKIRRFIGQGIVNKRAKLSKLNKLATSYRKTLIKSYNSVTAKKKKGRKKNRFIKAFVDYSKGNKPVIGDIII